MSSPVTVQCYGYTGGVGVVNAKFIHERRRVYPATRKRSTPAMSLINLTNPRSLVTLANSTLFRSSNKNLTYRNCPGVQLCCFLFYCQTN